MGGKEELLQDEFREICDRLGWRFTRQRFAVYAFIHGNRRHPSVDDVLKAVLSGKVAFVKLVFCDVDKTDQVEQELNSTYGRA